MVPRLRCNLPGFDDFSSASMKSLCIERVGANPLSNVREQPSAAERGTEVGRSRRDEKEVERDEE